MNIESEFEGVDFEEENDDQTCMDSVNVYSIAGSVQCIGQTQLLSTSINWNISTSIIAP